MGVFFSVAATILLILGFSVGPAIGGVLFSKLPMTLTVTAPLKLGQALRAGEDKMTVSWMLNQSLPADTDSAYKQVKVRLCYAPVSQTGRGWRKTQDDLKKDKTCQFDVTIQPYTASSASFEYTIGREIPTATYFVRAYVLDSSGTQVAYGQTTDSHKSTNLFQVVGINGRTMSLDIAAGCFSAFSVLSLVVFFVAEKRKTKK